MSLLETTVDTVAPPLPVLNPDEPTLHRWADLGEGEIQRQGQEQEHQNRKDRFGARAADQEIKDGPLQPANKPSQFETQLYTVSYLILFAILGVLARLGLQAITFYPGAPVIFTSLWPNLGGSLFMGFLIEDRMLFKAEWGTPTYHQQIEESKMRTVRGDGEESAAGSRRVVDLAGAKRAHLAIKKTIPLFVGLTTGFCGSFTSFSSFMRDAMLAMSNDLSTPEASSASRSGGDSVMAVLAVLITSISTSICALHAGAHLAVLVQPHTPSLPYPVARRVLDRAAVLLAWTSWAGAVVLALWPPDRDGGDAAAAGAPETWRGRAVFAVVVAPLGCLARFYASLRLNAKTPSFPLGTFAVNVFGTALLGACWVLQRLPVGGVVGCQVLQGFQDGFCGCLTTVSTWVAELAALRRSHAYKYGAASVVTAFCFLVVIMGGLRWSRGLAELLCVH